MPCRTHFLTDDSLAHPLQSVPDPTELSGNELAKSRSTRRRILDAARDLLAEQGYQRFSTGAVATRAGLTRPAMLYHFGNRHELVTAVINHLARRRIEMFEQAVNGATMPESVDSADFRSSVSEFSWKQLETPEFIAFTELTMAARTDSELAEVIGPALDAYDRARRKAAERAMPPNLLTPEDFHLARDVVRFLSEGAMQMGSVVEDREERLAALRDFVAYLVASPEGHSLLAATLAKRREKQADPAREAAE